MNTAPEQQDQQIIRFKPGDQIEEAVPLVQKFDSKKSEDAMSDTTGIMTTLDKNEGNDSHSERSNEEEEKK